MPSEPLPAKEVLDKLYTNWYATNVAEPEFTEVTGVGEPFRLDLNKKDHVVGKVGSPAMEEQPIGNYKYGNRTYNVELDKEDVDYNKHHMFVYVKILCNYFRKEN